MNTLYILRTTSLPHYAGAVCLVVFGGAIYFTLAGVLTP